MKKLDNAYTSNNLLYRTKTLKYIYFINFFFIYLLTLYLHVYVSYIIHNYACNLCETSWREPTQGESE